MSGILQTLLTGAVSPATFVAATTQSSTLLTTTVTLPSGTQAGDFVMIMVWQGFADTAAISGWTKSSLTWTNFGYFSAVFSKVVTSGSSVTLTTPDSGGTDFTIVSIAYRGGTHAASVKSTNLGDTGTTLPLTGFTKSPGCRGIVSFAQDRDGSSSPTEPSGFAMRAGPGGFGAFSGNVADILTLASYTNGSTVTWTGFDSGLDQVGWLIELL